MCSSPSGTSTRARRSQRRGRARDGDGQDDGRDRCRDVRVAAQARPRRREGADRDERGRSLPRPGRSTRHARGRHGPARPATPDDETPTRSSATSARAAPRRSRAVALAGGGATRGDRRRLVPAAGDEPREARSSRRVPARSCERLGFTLEDAREITGSGPEGGSRIVTSLPGRRRGRPRRSRPPQQRPRADGAAVDPAARSSPYDRHSHGVEPPDGGPADLGASSST